MPRTAQYDRQSALAKAANLFWERGYNGVSLKQLERGLDMRPGSLYAAFGSKEALFLEALDAYAHQLNAQLAAARRREDDTLRALESFLRDVILTDETAAQPAKACMVVKTLLEATERETTIKRRADEWLETMERAFETILLQAQQAGELRSDVDCARLARLIQVQIIGIRAYAQRNVDNARLEPLLIDIFALLETYRPASEPETTTTEKSP